MMKRDDAEVAGVRAAAAGFDQHVGPVHQGQAVAVQRKEVPRGRRHSQEAGEDPAAVVRHDRAVGSQHHPWNARGAVDRLQLRDGHDGVLGLAGDHRVDVGRVLHRLDRRRRGVRAEAHQRRTEMPLELEHLAGVELERRRGAAVDHQPGTEAFGVQPRNHGLGREPLGRLVDHPEVDPQPAEQRRDHHQRVRRLRRAEHLVPLLAASLARERHAVHERRVDEQRRATNHRVSIPATGRPASASASSCPSGRPARPAPVPATVPPCSSAGRPGTIRVPGASAAIRRTSGCSTRPRGWTR